MSEKVAVTWNIKEDLVERARAYAKGSGISISGVVCLALAQYLKCVEEDANGRTC